MKQRASAENHLCLEYKSTHFTKDKKGLPDQGPHTQNYLWRRNPYGAAVYGAIVPRTA